MAKNIAPSKRVQVYDALKEFCKDIEQTGGIKPHEDKDGTFVPAADEEWIDIAETYLKACKALGRKPKIAKD